MKIGTGYPASLPCQAADILRYARFPVKELDCGRPAHRKVGTLRRVLFRDLMADQSKHAATRLAASHELTAPAHEPDLRFGA